MVGEYWRGPDCCGSRLVAGKPSAADRSSTWNRAIFEPPLVDFFLGPDASNTKDMPAFFPKILYKARAHYGIRSECHLMEQASEPSVASVLPLANRREREEDCIENLANIHLAPPAAALG
jgi:hypothetical protein